MSRSAQLKVSVADGKYIFYKFSDDWRIHVFRYGEPWIILEKCSNAILALMFEFADKK